MDSVENSDNCTVPSCRSHCVISVLNCNYWQNILVYKLSVIIRTFCQCALFLKIEQSPEWMELFNDWKISNSVPLSSCGCSATFCFQPNWHGGREKLQHQGEIACIFNSVWMGECSGLQGARNCKCVLVYWCMSLLDFLNSLCAFVIVNNVQCCKQRTPRERKLFPDAASVSGQEEARLIEFSSPVVKMTACSSQSAVDTWLMTEVN